MTIKDIARESGYAVGTVSRVLNNNPRVSEDARRKILAVVAQHGYQPNANAKHLKQQVPEGLALIVKGTQNALFADLLDKLQPCLEARGYTPTVYYNNVSTDELACAQTIFAERAADILLRCIEENAPARHETVPFELVEGESV